MAGYAAVLLLLLTTSILLYRNSLHISEQNQQFITQTLPTLDQVKRIDFVLGNIQISSFGLYGLTVKGNEFSTQLKANQQQIDDDLGKLASAGIDTQVLTQKLSSVMTPVLALQGVMGAASRDWDQARTELARIKQAVDGLRQELQQLQQATAQAAQQDAEIVTNQLSAMQRLILLSLGFAVLITVWAYWRARRKIVAPVTQLSSQLDTVAANSDLSEQVTVVGSKEVVAAASSVNTLLDAFRQIALDIQQSAIRLGASAEQLSGSASDTDDQMSGFSGQIDHLLSSIESFEQAISASSERSLSASEVALLGAQQVDDGANQIARNAEAIEQLAAQVDTSATMLTHLKQSGDQVGSVVETIAQIAEQTNLLALNAAIEAARAGESGRGFAVVADEVRTLASRTHESTHEINSILATIVSSIGSAVEAMEQNKLSAQQTVAQTHLTVDSLGAIQGTVIKLSEENKQLAHMAQQTHQSASDMREHINAISHGSQKVSLASRETRQASGDLSGLAASLNQSVARFRL